MANSSIVGTLRALLTLDTAQFDAAAKRVGDSAKTFSRDFKAVGQQATQLGSALTKTLTVPLLGIGVGAAKLAMDFESSFANVRKTVDASDVELAGLAMTFRNMAKEIPATTDELNKIAALGGQMGVPVQQLAEFTRHVAALGVAVDGISTEDAAAGLAQIGNVTGEGTTKIAEMASALVHLGNKSNATEADILEFTKRLIGAGNSVGMTVPEVMALGTAMANVGINAEAGGTAMSTVITKISVAVSKGGDSLKEFAKVADMSATEFAATFKRSPIEAIDLFIKGLARTKGEGADLNLIMGDLGTEGIRVADTLKRLAGAGDGVAKSLVIANEGFSAGNKHLEEAEKKYATTANQIQLLWNRIKDVGITIGNALLPAIQSAIQFANALVPVIDFLGKAFAAMPKPIQLGVIAVGLMAAAAGPLIFLFGQLALSASALAAAFTRQGIAARGLATAQGVLSGTSTTLLATWGRFAALLGVYAGAMFAGSKIADAHTEALERLAKAGEDLAKVDVLIALKEIELQQALDNTNDKLAYKLRQELEALKSGRARVTQQKAQADAERQIAFALDEAAEAQARVSTVMADAARQTDEAKEAAKKYAEEVIKLRSELSGRALQDDVRKLSDAMKGLTTQQLSSISVQANLVNEFDKLQASGARLTPQMIAIREEFRRNVPEWSQASENARVYVDDLNKAVDAHLKLKDAVFLPDVLFPIKFQNPFDMDPSENLGGKMGDGWKTAGEIMEEAAKAAREEFDELTATIDQSARVLTQLGQVMGNQFVTNIGRSVSALNDMRVGLASTANTAQQAMGIWGAFVAVGEAVSGDNRDRWIGLNAEFSRLTQELRAAGVEAAVLAPILLRAGGNLAQLMRDNDIERFGQFNAELRAVLDSLEAVEQAELDLAAAMEKEGEEVDRVRQLTEEYGISFDALGNTIQDAELSQEFQKLAKDFEFLTKRGADVSVVLIGMADEAQAFLDRAFEFGTAVPESMRPMLQALVDAGLLTDAAGNKLEDLSGISFKPTETGLTDVVNVVKALPDQIADALLKAFGQIGNSATFLADDLQAKLGNLRFKARMDVDTEAPEAPTRGFTWPDMPYIPNLDTGTGGAYPNWGPGGTIVRLHDRERVSTLGEGRAEAGQMGSLLDRFDRFADQQARMPSELARAVRAAIQLA